MSRHKQNGNLAESIEFSRRQFLVASAIAGGGLALGLPVATSNALAQTAAINGSNFNFSFF